MRQPAFHLDTAGIQINSGGGHSMHAQRRLLHSIDTVLAAHAIYADQVGRIFALNVGFTNRHGFTNVLIHFNESTIHSVKLTQYQLQSHQNRHRLKAAFDPAVAAADREMRTCVAAQQ